MSKLFKIITAVFLLGIIPMAYGLQQTAGPVDITLKNGEEGQFSWGLVSYESHPIEVHLRAEGDGSEFLVFPDVITLEHGIVEYVTVTVDIPDDARPAKYNMSLYATQKGDGAVSVNLSMQKDVSVTVKENSNGGGCLVATAAYGTEMAPQIQMLREIRDAKLMQTESGRLFMDSFNVVYYSFSPSISDYQRGNNSFNGMMQLLITPMIHSLYIMDLADSEGMVVSLGSLVIALNGLMYLGAPAAAVLFARRVL